MPVMDRPDLCAGCNRNEHHAHEPRFRVSVDGTPSEEHPCECFCDPINRAAAVNDIIRYVYEGGEPQ